MQCYIQNSESLDDDYPIVRNEHDVIEFLSSEIIDVEALAKPQEAKKLKTKRRTIHIREVRDEHRHKISRVVVLVSFLMLGCCISLIAVSFVTSGSIDEMVRNSNEILRKHYRTTMKPIAEVVNRHNTSLL